jgi:mycofactocin glycosyltransferase
MDGTVGESWLPLIPRPPTDQGYPAGVPISLDRATRTRRNGLLLTGGDPPRIMRLSAVGRDALRTMQSSGATEASAARALARRLTDAGLAHPRRGHRTMPAIASLVTVVIPVRDRAAELTRCLTALTDRAARPHVIVVDDGSTEIDAVTQACQAHSAQLIRMPTSHGPAAARNAAVPHVRTELIAFLDCDCIPDSDWLRQLTDHFTDPLIAAVAPRIRGIPPGPHTAIARHAAAHAPIDLGPHPARVVPQQRVSYLPTAALLVRTAALGSGFDPTLRYGEDVDLVWRLHDAGWRIRYDPSVTVRHTEPATWTSLIRRRYRYGTSAAPLAARHPGRLSPLVISPWPTAATFAALAGHPLTATAIIIYQARSLTTSVGSIDVTLAEIARWPIYATAQTFLATGKAATTFTPWLLAAGVTNRRTRNASLALLLAPPLVDWVRRRPQLDPVRSTALTIADNVAYGAGVLTASISSRSWDAIRPQLLTSRRASVHPPA